MKEYFVDSSDDKSIPMIWCHECEEINLWAYWQGSLNAKILLVGQDWGSPYDKTAANVMSNIRAMKSGADVSYMQGNDSKTNNNLKILFSVLDYDIEKKEEDLFFTNFVLGYRNHGFSGGRLNDWEETSAHFFYELVDIVEPEIIICLGKFTFLGVLYAFGQKKKISNYNRFIESDENPINVELKNKKTISVYAVAHCGIMGTMNRNGRKSSDNLDKQKEDWRRICKKITWR
ncbi:MAG: hypothetical protein IJN48_02560 [Clostridia bacterium]|nr:hypothetical protein [Clostridia bacterium]